MSAQALRGARRTFFSIAHWLAIILLVVSVWSGVLLAIDQRPWLKSLLGWWPGLMQVPLMHWFAGLAWLALLVSYGIYLYWGRAEVTSTSPELAQHRLSISLLRWLLCGLLASGSLLMFNALPPAQALLHDVHAMAALAVFLLVLWHVLVQWAIGAWPRMQHLFIPKKVVALSRALAVIVASGILLIGGLLYWQGAQTFYVPRIASEMQIDGVANEAVWQQARTSVVNTYYGAPFQRSVPVEINMLHDGFSLYLFAKWPDPSKSMQHLPLIKTAKGWQVQQSALLAADEQEFYEDKFAVMLSSEPLAALRSVFLAPQQGRGGHVMPGKKLVDIWHWKSVRNHQFANLDDAFFAQQLPQIPGMRRNTWGYASDPILAGGYKENWAWFAPSGVTPLRLPRQVDGLQKFQAPCSNDCPAFALDWHDTQPYRSELDHYPIGTRMPSVVWMHANEGDRADVRATGVWRDGYWHLEMARGLATGAGTGKELRDSRPYDLNIANGTYLWFATFDHSQVRHTYHWRPLRLELATEQVPTQVPALSAKMPKS